jgi:hypothetical protein
MSCNLYGNRSHTNLKSLLETDGGEVETVETLRQITQHMGIYEQEI